MKEIAKALVKAQKAFGPALKTSTNPHYKSQYADLSACVEAVVDSLNNNGIALVQTCHESADGVTVETVFIHESGEKFESGKLHVPASKQDPQGYGSALTYARRYSLMAACGIAPEDDDGNAASKKDKTKPAERGANAGSFDALAPDEKILAKKVANLVVDLWSEGKEVAAYEQVYCNDKSHEFNLGVWDLLKPHSAIRTALKKMKEADNVAQQA